MQAKMMLIVPFVQNSTRCKIKDNSNKKTTNQTPKQHRHKIPNKKPLQLNKPNHTEVKLMTVIKRSFNTDCFSSQNYCCTGLWWKSVRTLAGAGFYLWDRLYILENVIQYTILLVIPSERRSYVGGLPLTAGNALFCIPYIQLSALFELYILYF